MWNPWKKIRQQNRLIELLKENIRLKDSLLRAQAAQGIEVRFVDPPVGSFKELAPTNSYLN
jgi:hypothetical protein